MVVVLIAGVVWLPSALALKLALKTIFVRQTSSGRSAIEQGGSEKYIE